MFFDPFCINLETVLKNISVVFKGLERVHPRTTRRARLHMDRDGRRGWRRRTCAPSTVTRSTRREQLLFQAVLTVGVIGAPTVE